MKHILTGKNTSTAISVSESLFNEARSLALAKRCNARLMVDINDPDNDNYLRRIVIAHQRIDIDGSIIEDEWIVASRGYKIPGNAHFSRTYSRLNNGDPVLTEEISAANIDKTQYAGEYVYYEFNGEGIFQNPGASFVIGAGIRGNGDAEPRTTKSDGKDFAGFVVWRNGRTSAFRNPDHINIDENINTF